MADDYRLVSEDDPWADRIDFLMGVMVSTYERRRFQTEVINELPLYPTEAILWDENQVPDVHYTGSAVKVELQNALHGNEQPASQCQESYLAMQTVSCAVR